MFTGIIEAMGKVISIEKEGENIHFEIESDLAPHLKIDQSISHSGVCLTVVSHSDTSYKVTAIKETLDKSNMGSLAPGSLVNLERAMKLGERLDGHIVQGHVDQTAICNNVEVLEGSWVFTFRYDDRAGNITIEKGSITVNGVSLTVVNSKKGEFSVAIIPYTYENTNFNQIKEGSVVNLEFDVVGKYIQQLIGQHYSH
jgi:riboflavin synthase